MADEHEHGGAVHGASEPAIELVGSDDTRLIRGGNPAVIGRALLAAIAGTKLGEAFGSVDVSKLPKPAKKIDWKKIVGSVQQR
jgi:hypothetical protein